MDLCSHPVGGNIHPLKTIVFPLTKHSELPLLRDGVNYYYVHYSRPWPMLEENNIFRLGRLVKWLSVLHILLIIHTMYINITLKFRSSL